MSDGVVRIVVKYCGGCNPLYDRVDLVRRIRERFPDSMRFVSQGEVEDERDAVLVVHGCHVQCAGTADVSHLPILHINRPEDIDDLEERIQAMLLAYEIE